MRVDTAAKQSSARVSVDLLALPRCSWIVYFDNASNVSVTDLWFPNFSELLFPDIKHETWSDVITSRMRETLFTFDNFSYEERNKMNRIQ